MQNIEFKKNLGYPQKNIASPKTFPVTTSKLWPFKKQYQSSKAILMLNCQKLDYLEYLE